LYSNFALLKPFFSPSLTLTIAFHFLSLGEISRGEGVSPDTTTISQFDDKGTSRASSAIDNKLQCTKGACMGNPIMMTLSEIDSAIARNIMKWRRLTRSAVELDTGFAPNTQQFGQSLDPHWFDREGRIMAAAEITGSHQDSNTLWAPTKNPTDAQMVRFKLSEIYQAVVLARLAMGAMVVFALFVNNPVESANSKPHIAIGASEEIATSLCALATVGIDAEIQADIPDD